MDINQVKKITELPELSNLSGSEYLEVVKNNINYKVLSSILRGVTNFNTLTNTTINFKDNINYTLNLTENITINVINATPGEVRVINTSQSGEFELLLPEGHYKLSGWEVVTPTSNNIISYTVLYDGIRYLWTRAAYEL